MNVLVTGANGQTGLIVLRKLLEGKDQFKPSGLVRTQEAAEKVKASLGADVNLQLGDVTQPETLSAAMAGKDAVIILTSAMPKLRLLSLPGTILRKMMGDKTAKPDFYYLPGQEPEIIDWQGQCNQIDAAKAAGVKHIVLISSMAGTQPSHFLNMIGSGHIVLWKRKAERYLMTSGVPYTIIHPGGLMPHPPKREPAPGGERELVVAVDDALLETENKLIPREDVAEVCVKCLTTPEALNRSFDIASYPVGQGTVWDGDLAALLAKLGGANCKYDEPEWP
eukprot:GGOE01055756.1.p1 GENE.GGOE01055756.1~~GGOE01055756.1.p1  ORF type:complete len:280 (+),score=73.08 GGOE01055756.1:140-979(+)